MMKKTVLITAMLLAACIPGFSKYRNFTSSNESNFKLVQIDQYDQATLFYFQVKATEERTGISVNDNTKITVDGDYRAYHLQQAINIPFSSENRSAYLASEGDELNMVLVFDRIPLDKPFSMIEKEGKTGNYFNFKGITVDLASESDKIDTDAFVQATDYVVREKYEANGKHWMSYSVNGLGVDMNLQGEYLNLTRIGKVNIVVTNDTGRPVTISADNIKVEVAKKNKSEFVEVPLWEVTKYDSKIAGDNSLNVSSYEDRINPIASALGTYRTRQGNDTPIGRQILLASAEMVARASTQSKVDAYAATLEKNRQRAWEDYLQTTSLDSGETYGGYITFKDKDYAKYVIRITVGGHDFVFHFNG